MKQSKSMIDTRRHTIMECLRKNKSMKVETLSDMLQVSELTIRRDLQALEEQGQVVRFFGGAEIARNAEKVRIFEEKKEMNLSEKEIVADFAATLLSERTAIFMNSGTTVIEIMRRLRDKNMAIITNNALACEVLEGGNCDLLCTGGIYNNRTKSYIGEFAGNLLRETYAGTAILGVNGISADSGLTTPVFEETMIYKLMLQRCRGKKIVVTDGSKVGKVRSYKSADITEIDMLVTTSSADETELEKIRNQGVQVFLADKIK